MKSFQSTYFLLSTLIAISCSNPNSESKAFLLNDTSINVQMDSIEAKISTHSNENSSGLPPRAIETQQSIITKILDVPSVSNFYKHLDQKEQNFYINPSIDTNIICEKGTSIGFKAHAFISETTGNEITDKVNIKVKEYYHVSEMLLAQLSTTSGNEIIETGGMLHISAISNGINCILKNGKEMEIGFPYIEKKDNMQLFLGEKDNNKINWKLPIDQIISDTINPPMFVVEQMPEFPGGDYELRNYLNQNIIIPYSAIKSGIGGKVFVQFVIDVDGKPTKFKVVRGVSPILDKIALILVRKMPIWEPGKQSGVPVNVQYVIPINFIVNDLKSYTEKEIEEAKQFEEALKISNDNYPNPINYTKSTDFSEKNKIDPTIIPKITKYIINTTKLGWLNCDRFLTSSQLNIDYLVNVTEPNKTQVFLVFHRMRSILFSSMTTNKHVFAKVPKDERITIVAYKFSDDKVFLATKETTITSTGESELDFQPVTLPFLKSELEKLNEIGNQKRKP